MSEKSFKFADFFWYLQLFFSQLWLSKSIFCETCLSLSLNLTWNLQFCYSHSRNLWTQSKHIAKKTCLVIKSISVIFSRFHKFPALMPIWLRRAVLNTFMALQVELPSIHSTMQTLFNLPTKTSKSASGFIKMFWVY